MSEGKKKFRLSGYREKARRDPFIIAVDDDDESQDITIRTPSSAQLFDAEDAMREGSSRDFIRKLCGDVGDQVIDLFANEDAGALEELVEDVQKHFGLGERSASPA